MRGSMGLTALSELGVIDVLTHDCIGRGEDGHTLTSQWSHPLPARHAPDAGIPTRR